MSTHQFPQIPNRVSDIEDFEDKASTREGDLEQEGVGVDKYLNVALERETEEEFKEDNSGKILGEQEEVLEEETDTDTNAALERLQEDLGETVQ